MHVLSAYITCLQFLYWIKLWRKRECLCLFYLPFRLVNINRRIEIEILLIILMKIWFHDTNISCNANCGYWQNMKMLIFELNYSLIFILPLVCENVNKFVFQVVVTYVAFCCMILFIMQGSSHCSCCFAKMKGVMIY